MAIDLGDAFLNFKANLSGLKTGLTNARGMLTSYASRAKKILGGIAKVGAGIGVAAAAGFIFATKSAIAFDKAMREVNTLLGLSASEFRNFKDEVTDLSTEMGIGLSDATDAVYQAISAGVPKENVIAFLEDASKLAIGGVTDLTSSVDVLTSVMNAYGIEANEVSGVNDALFTAVKDGKTTIDELSRAVFQVAPFAAQAGVSLDEMLAAMAAITKVGTPTRVAATQLREAIKAITAPTDQGAAAMEAAGIQFGVTAIKAKGLQAVLNQVTDAADGDQLALRKLLGSVEAMQGVLSLTGSNADTFAESLANMEQKTGAAQAAFEEMEQGPARAIEKTTNKMKNLNKEIGAVSLSTIAGVFGETSDQDRNISFLDDAINGVRELRKAIESTDGQSSIDKLKNGYMDFFNDVIDIWGDIGEKINEVIQSYIEGFEMFFDVIGERLYEFKEIWRDIFDSIGEMVDGLIDKYMNATQSFIDALGVGGLAEYLGEREALGTSMNDPNPLRERDPNRTEDVQTGSVAAASQVVINVHGGNPADIVAAVKDAARRGDFAAQGAI